MEKTLMEGYEGVKFNPQPINPALPARCAGLHPHFRACGIRLSRHEMTPANGGNMSQRCPEGFVITSSGSNLRDIEAHEISLVEDWSLEEEWVRYSGLERPSSEAMLHGLLYQRLPQAGAVVHAHDELATARPLAGRLPETVREEPYGTVALARLAAEALASGAEIIVLKNHGYVAIGADLEEATERIVQMHLRLLASLP